jgi:biopolymer transport protein ExbB
MFSGILQLLTEYLKDGGWVMPPLVIGTVVLWFAIGYRFATLKRGTTRGVRDLLARAEQGKQPPKDGIIVRAMQKGLALKATATGADLRPLLDDAFWEEERDLARYDVLITTIVLSAPLLGLLGTVMGMIETFDSLGDMSLFSQSGGIAGGIAQALITTQMGLAVAIPGLIGNGALNRLAKEIELELAQMKDMLCTDMIAGSY